MKTTFALLTLIVGVGSICAQGTFQFAATLSGSNENPPNNSQYDGLASFTLAGVTLSYSLQTGPMDTPNVAPTINGPGLAGPILFSINGPPILVTGQSSASSDGWYWGAGAFTLSSGQIAELKAGQFYVNVPTVNFPNGELAGQIVSVPEPSSLALLAFGGGLCAFPALISYRARKSRGGKY